jgi:hypothetical protein
MPYKGLILVPREYMQRKTPRETTPHCRRKPFCYHLLVQILTEQFAVNFDIWTRSGKLTASSRWPVTNVFQIENNTLSWVQFMIVRVI